MPQTQTMTAGLILTILKTKNIITFLIAIICITSLYSFEFFQNFSKEYEHAKSEYQIEIDNVKNTLTEVKKEAKGSEAYNNYVKAKAQKSIAKKNYFNVKDKEQFLGFKSFQLFAAQFGPMLCFFIYILYMIFRAFYFDRKNVGVKVLHGLILTGPIFYFYWIFQPFQDVSKVTYYFMTFVSATVVVFAVFLITKYQDHRINRLKKGQFELAKFTFKNTKPEKREEMLTTIERIVKDN